MEVYMELKHIAFAEFEAKVNIIERKVRMIEVATKESSMIVHLSHMQSCPDCMWLRCLLLSAN